MKKYKGYQYFCDNGIWKVKLDKDSVFAVGLDDSKLSGKKTMNPENNSEMACKQYIELVDTLI